MRYDILFGGKAGQGPNILSELVAKGLLQKGYYVFYSRDYQSLIRGGHNFNVLSLSDKEIASNDDNINLLVALDENTKKLHSKELEQDAIVLEGQHPNMYFAGSLFKILDIDFKILDSLLKDLKRRYDENIKEAKQGYENEKRSIKLPKVSKKNLILMNGNQAIAHAAIKSDLDIYYAYPMTPATGVLMELAQETKQKSAKHLAIQLENEIAVANAGIGSAITGAKTMVGTSGGGFDLMTEALSLTGQAAVPLVIYLSQRPGPATGVPTYQAQGDLNIALYAGHGEFPRVVIAPGDAKEALELTSQCFYLSQKFRIPAILLGDKHLAESKYSLTSDYKITKSPKSIKKLERFSSYETDKEISSTEDTNLINKNIEQRIAKQQLLNKEVGKFQTYKIHGNKNSKNLVIGWGSTKGAILDAISEANLDCKFLQMIYLKPFPKQVREEIKKYNPKNIFVIENNATSPLSCLIAHKVCVSIPQTNKILKFDGRPFTDTEVANKLKKLLK